MDVTATLALVVIALAVEAAAGYPQPLFERIGHPVTWIGALIARLDARLNRDDDIPAARRLRGVLALVLLLVVVGGVAWVIQAAAVAMGPWGTLALLPIVMSSLYAQRSLHDHVAAVRDGLRAGGLEGGRTAVARIVGRNPRVLDEAGVARAAIESLAENFSDGVTAPVLWTALGGLPGGAMYKAANTADSMIGHRTPRHAAFGWAAARFDDLINLPASRLTAILIVLAALAPGYDWRGSLRAVWRDARLHKSPNAGWPEAAMAGALGLRLAGPRVYGDTAVVDRWMGDGRAEATANDIDRALKLYRGALALQAVLYLSLLSFSID
ncbi:MAG TPA: adenosylcobinamide-phosphate synthase CbiB [Methylomirabilota bacterium]|nr:adenosylcobinamide-phosphate synthase CbiB [Methylomirabilota bacterium]